MVERVVGQLSLWDSLVSVPGESMLSELDAAMNWAAGIAGPTRRVEAGNSSYPAEPLLRCLLLGVCMGCSIRRWSERLPIGSRSVVCRLQSARPNP